MNVSKWGLLTSSVSSLLFIPTQHVSKRRKRSSQQNIYGHDMSSIIYINCIVLQPIRKHPPTTVDFLTREYKTRSDPSQFLSLSTEVNQRLKLDLLIPNILLRAWRHGQHRLDLLGISVNITTSMYPFNVTHPLSRSLSFVFKIKK